MTKEKLIDIIFYVAAIMIAILVPFAILVIIKNNNKVNNSTPVEEIRHIDNIEKDNVKLNTEINILDSLKNDKVLEVKALDNDCTLILFYKLIGKEF